MSQHRTLLRARRLLRDAMSPVEQDMGVLLYGGAIIDVAPYDDLRGVGAEVVEWDGLVMPGLVDAHSHLRGISTRRQGVEDAELERWVVRLGALTALDGRADALVAACDLLRTGVTGVLAVHHSFAGPEEYLASARAMRGALLTAGLRGDVVLGVTDAHELAPAGAVVSAAPPPVDAPALLHALAGLGLGDRTGDVRWATGPVGPQWCTDATLAGIAALAAEHGLRVHTHLMETVHQRDWVPDGTPVERLARTGLLSDALSVAHGVWLSRSEQAELAAAGATAVHCPTSNLRLRSGSAPVPAWLAAGLPVALGMDSATEEDGPDMFAELRAAVRNAELHERPGLHREVLAMATTGGARALGRRRLGAVARGYDADLVLLDGPPADAPDVESLVESASRHDVRRVLVDGELRLDDGVPAGCPEVDDLRAGLLGTVDEDEVARRFRLASLAAAEAEVGEALGALAGGPGARR
ncbi:MAG: amidohydrolase family protein [Nocardioidaceae bacterium]|nr:amidohydrolase family protein [Nocardioidaceae bacterium]